MKKILALLIVFCFLFFAVTGCAVYPETNANQGNNTQNNYQQNYIEQNKKEEIILTKENIEQYLEINFSIEDFSVSKSTAFNPPMDKGTGKIVIETTALKRGDFEDASISLKFESKRGWDKETVQIVLPFDGNTNKTVDVLCYSSLLYDNPRYKMTISSVTGKFVK